MVLGVAERELGYTFAQSLDEDGVERVLVVCGYEKMTLGELVPHEFGSYLMAK